MTLRLFSRVDVGEGREDDEGPEGGLWGRGQGPRDRGAARCLDRKQGKTRSFMLGWPEGEGGFCQNFLYLKLTCPSEPVGEGKELLNLVVGLGGEN